MGGEVNQGRLGQQLLDAGFAGLIAGQHGNLEQVANGFGFELGTGEAGKGVWVNAPLGLGMNTVGMVGLPTIRACSANRALSGVEGAMHLRNQTPEWRGR
ncbi:MAG: hypothetical protein HC812_09960 [Leptolyngbya sp. RL_3_1]|nr:hypothetical protein [Leptolyngbya sp. RL_3_1]